MTQNGYPKPFATSKQLPFDVWGEVFFHCLPLDHFIQPSAFTAPLLLCQINRAWRDLALSMPRLWSSLSVKIGRNGCIPNTKLVSPWLSRAGAHPLCISLTIDRRPGFGAFMNADTALRSVIPFFSTWNRIVINFGPFLTLTSLSLLPDTIAPQFDSLGLYLPASYEEASNHMSLIFNRSPRLRELKLTTEVTGKYIPNLKVPFGSLTSLVLSMAVFTLDNCCEVIEQCPNLVTLQLDNLEGNFQQVRSGPPVVLQNLQTLIVSSSSQQMNVFFDTFTFPSLLDVSCLILYSFPMHSFLNLVGRSSCSLASLQLAANMTEEDLLQCLQGCSSLKTLFLESTNEGFVTDRVLESLTFDNSGPSLCPTLESIALGEACISSSDGKLARMIESRFINRNSSTSCLRRVSVSIGSGYTQDIVWRNCKRRGSM